MLAFSLPGAVAYIGAFAVGTIAAMVMASSTIAAGAWLGGRCLAGLGRGISVLYALAAIAVGCWWVIDPG